MKSGCSKPDEQSERAHQVSEREAWPKQEPTRAHLVAVESRHLVPEHPFMRLEGPQELSVAEQSLDIRMNCQVLEPDRIAMPFQEVNSVD